MVIYNPDEVKVTVGGVEVAQVRMPNILFKDLAEYPKDHPDYREGIVRVTFLQVNGSDGNKHSVDTYVFKDSNAHKDFLALDPYDNTSVTVKVG